MDISLRTYETMGLSGVLTALGRCSPADQQALIPVLEQIFPRAVLEMGSELYRRAIRKAVSSFLESFKGKRIVLLQPELDVYGALAVEEFHGSISVVVGHGVDADEFAAMKRNVPCRLDVKFGLPGTLPAFFEREVCVLAIAFEAGSDVILVDREIEARMGLVKGRRFHGDSFALVLNPDEPFTGRTARFNTMRRSEFRWICTPFSVEQTLVTV